MIAGIAAEHAVLREYQIVSDNPRRCGTAPPHRIALTDRLRVPGRLLRVQATTNIRLGEPCRVDNGACGRGNSAGGLEEGLGDLPAGVERRGGSLGREQQPTGLQGRSRARGFGHARPGQGHDPAGFLAAGGDHRLAGFEPDAATATADLERVGGQVAIRHVLG